MKINPPKAIIDPSKPFENALFDRKDFAESLTSLLRNVSENLVIFVNAPWGEGKTTFSQMWRAHLQQQKLDVIYFDAYAADYFDDPFVSFSGEILELVDKRFKEGKRLAERQEFKKTAVEVGKRFAGLATKVALKAATLGVVDSTHVDEFQKIGADIASGISKIGSDFIEKKIENYGVEKDSLRKFKTSLAALAAKIREKQGFPLVIIVDELDRCRPDFALGLLERIKHLFDVEGVAFVLLVNREQIESYIRTVYGEVNARAYLLKFGNLFVDLPNQKSIFSVRDQKSRRDYCSLLLQHYGFSEKVNDQIFLTHSIELVSDHFGLTLREIERVFTIMSFYYSSLLKNQLTQEFLIVMLSALKVKNPLIYNRLSSGGISIKNFFMETYLDKIKQNRDQIPAQDWVSGIINFCLMSDAEFEIATTHNGERDFSRGPGRFGSWLTRYNIRRENVIPLFCSKLNLFLSQPQLNT